MRIRTVKPEFWRSDDVDALPLEDRLLFIGLWMIADDDGRAAYKPTAIMADLFAGDMERDLPATYDRVVSGLKRLENGGLIVRYEAQGRAYFWIPTFTEHQVINRPSASRLPPPPEPPTSGNTPDGALMEEDVATHGVVSGHSRLKGKEGKGKEGVSRSGDLALLPPPTERPKRRRPAAQTEDPHFDEWYKIYPRHDARLDAVRAYNRALRKPGVTVETLLDGARRYRRLVEAERREKRHMALPATWLNGERWNDEPTRIRAVRGGIDY